MKNISLPVKILLLCAILIIPSVAYLWLVTGKNKYNRLPIYGPKDEIAANGDTIYHKSKILAEERVRKFIGKGFGAEPCPVFLKAVHVPGFVLVEEGKGKVHS